MYNILETPVAPEHALVEPGSAARNGLTADDARVMAATLGLPAVGCEFLCILPGFSGTGLSVIDPASLRYQTLYPSAFREWFSLAEVYASRTAGCLLLFRGGIAAARWWGRLRHVAGLQLVDTPDLALPELSANAVRLAYGFALLRALDHEHHPGEPVMFSRRFAMNWCGLPQKATIAGLRELTSKGVLLKAGSAPAAHPRLKPTPLYDLSPKCLSTTPANEEVLVA